MAGVSSFALPNTAGVAGKQVREKVREPGTKLWVKGLASSVRQVSQSIRQGKPERIRPDESHKKKR